MLGLAAVAAVAVMPLVGAGSASANPIDICLYSSGSPALTKAGCESVGGTIDPETKSVTFMTKAKGVALALPDQNCKESIITAKTKGDGTPGIEVTAISFTGSCTPCPTVDTSPPYAGSIIMIGEDYFLQFPGSATLLGCFGFVNCKFSTEAASLKYVPGAGHTSNEFRAEAEKLTGPGGLCGTSGAWTASYVVSSPARWFFFL
jgi:hypothetical protein